ncbi:riboflavin kinase/FMN adenylyltransferase [Owenweeksia hongkongensis DSM 17368]|uniref:Riboflavin biosynthesis protein n=1 Tax=Owenweeksia hongkongensis (strain DSM 17368 / CIP 108786 / JCM 12287 / NRRL B-23963 / UST20020801) TaxID=926562 RepID=G8R0U2_OWEHD|nr:bifunctional riboflavin kinase/FAD synthetase [Owenweeksia hongkongensis]AEV33819.1 riboflavin kinase/FMN adenylyltransferase [Owenweeksia hongkongensis DSM 17368]
MKVYFSLEDFQKLDFAAVTTGTFDGVHIGHNKILEQLNQAAATIGGESVLLTFSPHPRIVLQPDVDLKLLSTQKEKIELLKNTGLDHLIIHPFTKEFSRTSSLDFVRNILVNNIGAKKLVIGYDHHFGRNREGSFEHLKEFGPTYGFEVEEISAKDIEDVTVSSTKIRRALNEGDLETANEYLGYDYPITGQVVEGEKIGNTIGFPTANLVAEETYKLIPMDGVYAVEVQFPSALEQKFQGMCNIGMRPTFSGKFKTIEVHIFNFNRNIYGEQMQIVFKRRLRGETKFDSIEALKTQLNNDMEHARKVLSSH